MTPGATQIFSFTPLAGAEALEVGTFVKVSTPWKETAEFSSASSVSRISEAPYPLLVNPASFAGFGALTGSTAYRLTIPVQFDPVTRTTPEQSFEVNRDIIPEPTTAARSSTYYRKNPYSTRGRELAGPVIPATEATLSFQFRRGFMTPSTFLAVEASTDGGDNWSVLGSLISGLSTTRVDTLPTTATRVLPLSSSPIRVRFRLFWRSSGAPGENYFIHKGAETFPTGIFIDEITTINCSELQAKSVRTLAPDSTQFAFNEASAGAPLVSSSEWQLRLRTRLAGTWFQYGPPKTVTVTTP
jgi:hypothetical protein